MCKVLFHTLPTKNNAVLNKQEFIYLLKNYTTLNNEHIAVLKNITQEYPYFSSANVLLAKAMNNVNHYEYDKQLKAAALQTGDRAVLYKIINNQDLNSSEVFNEMPYTPTFSEIEKVSLTNTTENTIEDTSDNNTLSNIKNNDNAELKTENNATNNYSQIDILDDDFSTLELFMNEEKDLNLTNENITADMSNEVIDFLPQNIIEEKKEINIDNNIHVLNKWNGDGVENISIEDEDSNIDLSIESDLRNEAKAIIDKPHNNINIPEKEDEQNNANYENISLAESTGNMLRYDYHYERDGESLVNLNEDELLKDFDFETVDENKNKHTNYQSTKVFETDDDEIEEKISDEFLPQVDEDIFDENERNNLATIKDNIYLTQEDEVPAMQHQIQVENDIEINNTNSTDTTINNNSTIEYKYSASLENLLDDSNISPLNNEHQTENHLDESVLNTEILLYEEIENREQHGFLDWLNTKTELPIIDNNLTENNNTNTSDTEADEFTLRIRQLILEKKERDEQNALLNIENKIDSIQESIDSEQNLYTQNEEDINVIETKNEDIEEEKIQQFYEHEIESILPEFNTIDDIEGHKNNPLENISDNEFQLTFHPIHGLVPLGFNDIENNNTNLDKQNDIEIAKTEVKEINFELTEENIDNNIKHEDITTTDHVLLPILDDNIFDGNFLKQFAPKETIKELETKTPIEINKNNTLNSKPKDEAAESIIDKFIRENPNISRPKAEFYSPSNMAKISAEEDNELVSETLANIYINQGLYKKAISSYEKLGLVYPHKIPYFAALISNLKTTHKIE